MRIFCAVRHSIDPQFYYGGLWASQFYPALREIGCEIVESQTDLLPASRFMAIAKDFTPEERTVRAQITESILAEVRRATREDPIDLFLSYFYNSHFAPEGFGELRRMGIPSINFYCNSMYQFDLVAEISPRVDFAWYPEKDARQYYLSVGANPVRVQMGADPKIYRPIAGIERESKACFVGQRYADRDRWLAGLVRAKVPVDIYGDGWGGANAPKNAGFPEEIYLGRRQVTPGTLASYVQLLTTGVKQNGLFGTVRNFAARAGHRYGTRRSMHAVQPHTKGKAGDLARVFSSYELVLNLSNVWAEGRPGSSLISHVRLRDFEAPMCRTCYLTGHSEEIQEFYDLRNEIDTYSNVDELADKARFYLANPGAAEKLREAGHRRALRDHTWTRRFSELFDKTGLKVRVRLS